MPLYEFECEEHGRVTIRRPIQEGPPRVHHCPICGEITRRVFEARPVIYKSQGFHQTDYDKHGDRLERANKQYKAETGENPPPPARDVPKNLSEPY